MRYLKALCKKAILLIESSFFPQLSGYSKYFFFWIVYFKCDSNFIEKMLQHFNRNDLYWISDALESSNTIFNAMNWQTRVLFNANGIWILQSIYLIFSSLHVIHIHCLLIFHLMFSIKMEFNTFFNTKRQTLLFIWCALNASTEKNRQNHWAFIKNALMENVVEGEKICSIQMNMTRTWNNNKN